MDTQRAADRLADLADLSGLPIASLAAAQDPEVAALIERIAPQVPGPERLKVAAFSSGIGLI